MKGENCQWEVLCTIFINFTTAFDNTIYTTLLLKVGHLCF